MNILKRLLIHTGGFNLGLLMRQLIGVGTARGLQGRLSAVVAALLALIASLRELPTVMGAAGDRSYRSSIAPSRDSASCTSACEMVFTTGC
jgi:hypothetical protein